MLLFSVRHDASYSAPVVFLFSTLNSKVLMTIILGLLNITGLCLLLLLAHQPGNPPSAVKVFPLEQSLQY